MNDEDMESGCGGYGFLGPDMEAVAEIVPGRLYFVTFRRKDFTKVDRDVHFFNTDQQLIYINYFDDFGPVNIAQLYRYWVILREKLTCPTLATKKLVHWTTTDFKKRANAAFLMGCFATLHLGATPDHVHRLLLCGKLPLVPFQDASPGVSKYRIKLIDCIRAVTRAKELGLFSLQDFDLTNYEHYEKVQNGDVSWIVPEKLVALSGPGTPGCPPEHYLPYFKAHGVKHLIRLSKSNYSDNKFTNASIAVHDMFFCDGSVPPKEIVYKFLALTEQVNGPLAVHCKAGLGRTGCLVGAYLVKHYRLPALEAIAWMRVVRPGCVIGHQQAWLERMEHYLIRSGQLFRLRVHGDVDEMPKHSRGIYSLRSRWPVPNVVSPTSKPTLLKVARQKLKSKLFPPSAKLGERRKKKKPLKEKCEMDRGESKSKEEMALQGDRLRRVKWEKAGITETNLARISRAKIPALSRKHLLNK